MKVFVLSDVTHFDYEGDSVEILGVYASRMAALRKVQEIVPKACLCDATTEEWLVEEQPCSQRYLYMSDWEVED